MSRGENARGDGPGDGRPFRVANASAQRRGAAGLGVWGPVLVPNVTSRARGAATGSDVGAKLGAGAGTGGDSTHPAFAMMIDTAVNA